MKKVGILSMQRVINYGSFLQAFGLKTLLEELGHTVSFVDIEPGLQYDFGTRNIDKIGYKSYTGFKKLRAVLDRYFIKRCIGQLYQKRLVALMKNKHTEQLGMPVDYVTDVACDTLVIGSDEVFNCTTPSRWGVSYPLLGAYRYADRVITYAASCGHTTADMLPDEIKAGVSAAFENVSAFSVRDANTRAFVTALTDKEVHNHLDPVLAADFTPYRKPYHFGKRYILVYAYTNRINLPEEIAAIKAFAKKHRLKTVSVGGYQCWCDHNLLVEPLQIFDVFEGAEYVVTDTFHGTVIAAKMNRPFASIIRSSNRNKLGDLIERLGMKDREVEDIACLEQVLERKIDFTKMNQMLREERARTLDYLSAEVEGKPIANDEIQ